MRKNMGKLGRPHVTIRRKRFACQITEATNTSSEYVIPTAFPLQRLHDSGKMLSNILNYSSNTTQVYLHRMLKCYVKT